MSSDEPSDAVKSHEAQPTPPPASGRAWVSGPMTGLGFALLGGLLAWALIQAFHPVFVNEKDANSFGVLPPRIQRALDRNNSIFPLAVLGGLAAGALAVGEGLCRRSATTAALAGMACLVLGAAVGGLAGYLGLMASQYDSTRHDLTDLTKAIRVQGMMLATLGAGVGLGAGVFLGRRIGTSIECLIAGALAGVLAGITYPVAVALLVPGAVTKSLIPLGAVDRLLWAGLAAGLLGLIIPSVARKRPTAPVAAANAA